jgi:hypothetical protein
MVKILSQFYFVTGAKLAMTAPISHRAATYAPRAATAFV